MDLVFRVGWTIASSTFSRIRPITVARNFFAPCTIGGFDAAVELPAEKAGLVLYDPAHRKNVQNGPRLLSP